MVLDRQKVWTDGRNGRTDGRRHGRRQNYILPTSSGDNKEQTIKQMKTVVNGRKMFTNEYGNNLRCLIILVNIVPLFSQSRRPGS